MPENSEDAKTSVKFLSTSLFNKSHLQLLCNLTETAFEVQDIVQSYEHMDIFFDIINLVMETEYNRVSYDKLEKMLMEDFTSPMLVKIYIWQRISLDLKEEGQSIMSETLKTNFLMKLGETVSVVLDIYLKISYIPTGSKYRQQESKDPNLANAESPFKYQVEWIREYVSDFNEWPRHENPYNRWALNKFREMLWVTESSIEASGPSL